MRMSARRVLLTASLIAAAVVAAWLVGMAYVITG